METMDTLEGYVCLLYGEMNTNVNNTRFEIFHKIHVNQLKVVDISLLAPCNSLLKLHCVTLLPEIVLPEHTRYGWNNDCSDESIPEELSEVLAENVDGMCGADEESDSDRRWC